MKPPLSIYVLVDALGWEILRDRPFLDDVLEDRRPLQTILGYSSGAIPTILTGRLPREHGHWNLFYRSPATSPFRWTRMLRPLPAPLVENPFGRRAVKHLSRWWSGYSGYFSIYAYPVAHLDQWDLTEKRDIYQPGGLDCPSLFDRLVGLGIPYECYNYHRHTDAEILALGARRAVDSDARVLFLYLADLDRYLHHFIHDGEGVSERLAWYAAGLRRIFTAAREVRETRMIVFSDHGMTPVRWTYDLRRDVAALGLSARDHLAAYDSTMARFWTWNARARERLVEALTDHPCGDLLGRDELERLGVWFDDDRYYQLLFVMKPGMLLNPGDMGDFRFAGMHGFHPSEPTADAVLLSSTALDKSVQHIAGIHDLLLGELGVGPAGEAPA
jgi:Type I phosphodiesterase / nucleotide pyrophosphatase